ncbi:hypothetical protein ACFQ3Z_18550 [Streptomyces nogalater]
MKYRPAVIAAAASAALLAGTPAAGAAEGTVAPCPPAPTCRPRTATTNSAI